MFISVSSKFETSKKSFLKETFQGPGLQLSGHCQQFKKKEQEKRNSNFKRKN